MYINKQINQLWKQINYLKQVHGIPITVISQKTDIHYQHLLNFYHGKLTLGSSGLEKLQAGIKKHYRVQLGI
ncbi:TPA: hypothetical protein ACIZD8_001259 [Enterococcus faecium]|uniref:hypothetical protein n=1 Tax=Enterococcus faecium TaxID=1352 RepID=UPI00358F1DA1|nr:hypothetical protein [Enterococcus faecium]HBM8865684.1 hypothetical protein [Enterococcus faecium]HCK2017841.1 hypothetical protein [Enterococcus faecium]